MFYTSKKLRFVGEGGFMHWCPACSSLHGIETEPQYEGCPIWTFNGDHDKPTFHPSINLAGRCHYFISDGKISYCPDSQHHLAGKTMDLPDIPERTL